MAGWIYMIRQSGTDRCYIGKTGRNDPADRWKQHRQELRAGRHHSYLLQCAWNECGEEAFSFVSIERVSSDEDLGSREAFWAAQYRAYFNILKPDPTAGAFRQSPAVWAALVADPAFRERERERMKAFTYNRAGEAAIKRLANKTTEELKVSAAKATETRRNRIRQRQQRMHP
jgi:hypothetical protein